MARGTRAGGGRTRYGLIAAGVMVIALLAGGAVAGLPDTVPDDIEPTDIRPATTATVAPPASAPGPDVEPTTSEAVGPSVASLQSTAATSVAATTTTSTTTTTTAPAQPPAGVRVVVANGAAADGLASSVAADLRNAGYADVVATNAVARRPASVVYYAVGFEREGAALAAALGISATEPQPVETITTSSSPSDLWVVLGADRL